MSVSTDEHALSAQYRALIPRFEDLIREIEFALRSQLSAISPSARVTSRVKDLDSLLGKIRRKSYANPLKEITDLAGVRVVCQFSSEVATAETLVKQTFDVIETVAKAEKLKSDRMGYQATHFIVRLPASSKGPRYDELKDFVCEIQVKTILQDAWAQIDHLLMYKSKESIPERERRELNNVSALLEIAQSIFDRTKETREAYTREVEGKFQRPAEFIDQSIDRETLGAYTRHRFPNLPIDTRVQEILLGDLDRSQYKTLQDVENAIVAAADAVAAYQREAPDLFKAGTDYITKSLGFADDKFRSRHGFASRTRQAFVKHQHLVKGRVR